MKNIDFYYLCSKNIKIKNIFFNFFILESVKLGVSFFLFGKIVLLVPHFRSNFAFGPSLI